MKIAEIIDAGWLNETGYYYPPLSKAAQLAKAVRARGPKPVRTYDEGKARREAKERMMQQMFPARNPEIPRPDPLIQAMRKLR
jgi:hypothetical protein